MTPTEKTNIRATLRDWEKMILRHGEYPQMLVCMKSPTELTVYRIPTMEVKHLILSMETVLEQLKAIQN